MRTDTQHKHKTESLSSASSASAELSAVAQSSYQQCLDHQTLLLRAGFRVFYSSGLIMCSSRLPF